VKNRTARMVSGKAVGLLGAAGLLALCLATQGCSRGGSTESLWLGHVAPMSGAEKSAGDHARQGIRIAVQRLDKPEELVLGRKVTVRHADAGDAEAEAVRLASVNRVVALLGGINTAQAEQIARGAESAGVPAVLQAAIPAANDNAYVIVPSLSRRGQVLGKFAATDGKWKTIAILTDERSRATGPVLEAFVKEFPVETSKRFTFKKEEELAGAVAKVTAAKPQAVLFVGSTGDFQRVRGEFQNTLLGTTVIFGGDETGLPTTTGEGVVLATPYLASDETTANREFVEKYEEHFHGSPDANAALAYDGTMLLAEVIRKAGTTNAAKLREALQQLEGFESVTGPLRFGKDHHARRPLYVVQIENGQAKLRKRFGADD